VRFCTSTTVCPVFDSYRPRFSAFVTAPNWTMRFPDKSSGTLRCAPGRAVSRRMESFFSSLKTERTANKIYRTRGEAKADMLDYIERFYNVNRRGVRKQAALNRVPSKLGPGQTAIQLAPIHDSCVRGSPITPIQQSARPLQEFAPQARLLT
jgi:hypothetical protein